MRNWSQFATGSIGDNGVRFIFLFQAKGEGSVGEILPPGASIRVERRKRRQ